MSIEPQVTPISDIADGGGNVPVTVVPDLEHFRPIDRLGASRYRATLADGLPLDSLLLNRGSDVLVVSLHGALDRTRFTLPRFERLNSIKDRDVSSLYLSDSCLHLDGHIQLAWFTGTRDVDLYEILARFVTTTAASIGATRIIFAGASGGGFASLQLAPLVPDSIALAFNPQTSVVDYLSGGTSLGAQRVYVQVVMPHLAPDGWQALDKDEDWSAPLGDRLSPKLRYSSPVDCKVLYVQNPHEFHYTDHYMPFLAAAARGGNLHKIRANEYAGDTRHNPPPLPIFHDNLDQAIAWSREL
ncbi:hypothetical protein NF556_19835 [Ornithinimicrobium faecis]|uniref:Uncharacterized protein n=1 Tax=Ornithinimicrobium faecis TaxID=2934158 RepID=A0ABY4YSR7_9MICO|nr:hypothetical protein [Ornithinimicrobium sp. HY1793]USQ79810.1 hypothetical protein NF556_19835 [Ornithinimicrobium sp. HY1793]